MDYTGSSNSRELNYILTESFMLRRLKKEVLAQLPPKRRQRIEVQCEATKLKIIKRALGMIMDELEENEIERERLMTMLEKDEEVI
jgi:SNF2 family DNA or RNA helicase